MYRSTHLVRAVMTKLLQIEGARLVEVAARLSGRSDAELWNEVGAVLQGGARSDASALRAHRAALAAEATATPPAEPASAAGRPLALTLAPGAHLMLEPHATRDPDELADALRRTLASLPPAAA